MKPAAQPVPVSPVVHSRPANLWFVIAALGYLCAGVIAMLAWSPRVPYADQWRHYAHLLTRPWPGNIFEVDNGHAEVVPNLLRLIDLRAFDGHESLQLYCGIALALAAALLLLRVLWRDRTLSVSTRAACAFAIVFGVFWLGNLRALTQTGDSVHVYLVLTCLAAALALVLRDAPRTVDIGGDLVGASLLCVVASFSFGSGFATFVALAAVMFARREPRRRLLVLGSVALGTLAVYSALRCGDDKPAIEPLAAITTSLRLFGTPIMYLFWPLLDPVAAAAVPEGPRSIALPIATAWAAHFGDIRRAVFPQAAFGAIGMALTLLMGLRIRRTGATATPTVCLGFALACFGIAVAVLIALVRTDYFLLHADQVSAPRYVPWSSLGWAGLLLAYLAQARRSQIAFGIAMLLPVLALPSEIGMGVLARRIRDVAENSALYAAVGVLPAEAPLGETDAYDLLTALSSLRTAGSAMFAWPETALLERTLADSTSHNPVAAARLVRVKAVDVNVAQIANRLGTTGRSISARIATSCVCDRAVIVDKDRVVGLLRPTQTGVWYGAARATEGDTSELSFYTLCD